MLNNLTRRDLIKAFLAISGVAFLPAKTGCEGKVVTLGPVTASLTETFTSTTTLAPVTIAPEPSTTTITSTITTTASGIPRPDGWSKVSHGNNVDPDYKVVFPQDRVNRFKITISPEDWNAMQADLQQLFAIGGAGQLPRVQPLVPAQADIIANGLDTRQAGFTAPSDSNLFPMLEPAPPGGRGGDMTPVNPIWVPCSVDFNGLTWTSVGVRYKCNSSLRTGWRNRSQKLPFKLDFDQYENEHPEINNQRFFGFKQLSLSNSFSDNTYMHETITYDLLEEAGLPASQTAYYQLIMDYGQGEKDLGIYIVVEVPDDTAIAHYFGEDTGNIYEANGSGVSLTAGTTPASIQKSFQKENNTDSDWSDLAGLYDALHSKIRATDAAAWRAGLEKVFDVDAFLEWLAISAIIQNWDNYGQMSHNFYLYHDPDTGRLVWISWDHNQVLAGGNIQGGNTVTLDKKDIRTDWPLIRFLLDDPVYYPKYVNFLSQTIEGPFTIEKMQSKTQQYATILKPYMNQTTFAQAVQQLNSVVSQRIQAVRSFLANP